MASSSVNSESTSNMQEDIPACETKGRTVNVKGLVVQKESPVDFGSLERNGVDIRGYFAAQQMTHYFNMLNGPTYENLVKDFCLKAEIFDRKAAQEEEKKLVTRNPGLKGNSRVEMGLKPFRGTEIRSTVMDMEVTITLEAITRACRCSNSGVFEWDADKDRWENKINGILFVGNPEAKKSEMSSIHRMLLKILTDSILQKGGGTDSPSLDHRWYCSAWLLLKRSIYLSTF